jgi:hypothetical protein
MRRGGSTVRLAAGRLLGAVFLAAFAVNGSAQDLGAEVTIQQVQFWSAPAKTLNHGPFACWLRLQNASLSLPHTVLLRASDGRGVVVAKRILLPPATQLQVPCVLPLAVSHGYGEFFVDGRRLQQQFEWPTATTSYGQYQVPVLLVSRRLPFDPLNEQLNAVPAKPAVKPGAEGDPDGGGLPGATEPGLGSGGMGFPGSAAKAEFVRLARAEPEVQAWPTDWQFYGGFEGVALTADELAALPAEALGALVRYAECGGAVVVFGAVPVPAGWEQMPLSESRGLAVREVGFGRWVGVPAAASPALTEEQVGGLREVLRARLLSTTEVTAALNRRPVVARATLPLKGTAAFVFLFALLAGPVNLWVLIRLKRRVWMLWTIPVLGLAFSVAIVVYYLLGEGVAPRGRLQVVTLLNESTRRATSLGVEGLYCPLPPRGGVAYEADWEVTAGSSGRWQARELDLTNALCFRRGWVRSRVPANFALRGSRHAAERLPLRFENGRVVAVNGLGAPIEFLRVATADGQVWEARDLEPGAEAVLGPASPPGLDAGRPVPVVDWWHGQAWLAPLPAAAYALAAGQYSATLKRSVFLRPVLAGAEIEETSLVIGIPETAIGSPAAGPAAGQAERE